MNSQPKRRHRKKGLGLSFKAFSDAIDVPLKDVLEMVAQKQVKVLTLGSLERIPYSEAARLKAELGTAAE